MADTDPQPTLGPLTHALPLQADAAPSVPETTLRGRARAADPGPHLRPGPAAPAAAARPVPPSAPRNHSGRGRKHRPGSLDLPRSRAPTAAATWRWLRRTPRQPEWSGSGSRSLAVRVSSVTAGPELHHLPPRRRDVLAREDASRQAASGPSPVPFAAASLPDCALRRGGLTETARARRRRACDELPVIRLPAGLTPAKARGAVAAAIPAQVVQRPSPTPGTVPHMVCFVGGSFSGVFDLTASPTSGWSQPPICC